jgi:uncharacterized protein with HEPN domain
MSLRDKQLYLWDILAAAESIFSMVQDKSIEDYLNTRPLRSAVEREFEIMGEALNQAAKASPEIKERITDFAKIVGFRNRLAHAYFAIDAEVIWGTIEVFLPRLVKEVKSLLEAEDEN